MTVATWFKGKRKDDAESTQQVDAQVITEAIAYPAPPEPEPAPEYADAVEPAPPAIDPAAFDQLAAERRAMVALCLYAHDRARSSGVAERLEEGLAGVGVEALRPDGQRFDPAVHEAGGTADTDDPALDGLVAETEVVGFSDRGHVLRPPIVTVYKAHTA
ncbi:hypothetical protein GCM10023148_36940 [Actinokineospora soli]